MSHNEKTLKSEYFFKGYVIKLRKDNVLLENNTEATREVVEHPGGVAVLPLTDDNEVIFVKQFRYPYMKEILELPAGKLDGKGEDPFLCGKRELKEEVGATSDNYTPLGMLYPSPGFCDEIIHLYLAQDLSYGSQNLDEDEFLDVIKIPFDKAYEMVINNEIEDAKTQIAILKAKHILEK